MPKARATARSERSVPSSASLRLASCLISSVISARARARAVVGALATGMGASCTQTRAVATVTSTALDSERQSCDARSMTRAPLTETDTRYVQPSRFDTVVNRAVRRLVRMGISVWGARDLRLRGRKSGEIRSNVVNLLDLDGAQFIVAPRGTTEWVKNLRAAGGGELRVGRR